MNVFRVLGSLTRKNSTGTVRFQIFTLLPIHFSVLDIIKLRRNIWKVAKSLPVKFEKANEDRILGWKIPKFYFALDEKIKENVNRKDQRIATISVKDVKDEIQRFDDQQDCNSPAILVNCLLEDDICEMLRFLKDTGTTLNLFSTFIL